MTESTHPLAIYFQHNRWSNLLLLDACAGLDAEQLQYTANGTFGSIHATLGHIVSAEEFYIFVVSEAEGERPARPDGNIALAELRSRAESSGNALLQLATTVDGSEKLHRPLEDGSLFSISKEALLLQAIHHGHEHRTQIESMLGQLGIDPPGLSAWRYSAEVLEK